MPNNLITLTEKQYYEGKDGINGQLSGDDKQYGNYQFIKIDCYSIDSCIINQRYL